MQWPITFHDEYDDSTMEVMIIVMMVVIPIKYDLK